MSDYLDDLVGDRLERVVARHHRRRLHRLGHDGVMNPTSAEAGLWVPGPRAPRSGNAMQVLIDGDEALASISDALEAATSHIHIAGWHLAPDFRLRRDVGAPALARQLATLADRVEVRVLLWAGPPLPAFQPTRSMMKDVRRQLTAQSKVQCVLDARERTLHCHHEKIIVVDDEIAFVGGIDLSDLSGDRWDRNRHEPRGSLGWHDATSRLRGPIVADVAHHFRDRWQEAAGEQLAIPVEQPAAGKIEVQLTRTVPERTYGFVPHGEFSILDNYLRALRGAEEFIYLENQFLWSTEIVRVLAEKLRRPPNDRFRLVLVLPARPTNGADTTRGQLGYLLDADGDAGRILAATVRAHSADHTDSLYVHAKIGIVDDHWLTIGSANLNEHSLFNDTEVNVTTLDRELARSTRIRLWAEHLELAESDLGGDPIDIIDRIWKPLAQEQLDRSNAGAQPTHRLTRLAAVSRRTERLLGPVRGLLVDA